MMGWILFACFQAFCIGWTLERYVPQPLHTAVQIAQIMSVVVAGAWYLGLFVRGRKP